ncbi:MAG: YafY family protein [Clostridium sp.]|nr:YafY family protein [Clostridium sp.]
MSKLSHLLELILMLQYKEFTTASELADLLEVDKKTIYRYIDTLQMSNVPVESKKGRYGGFYINKEFYMKYPKLDRNELQALLLASKILTKENGFFYADEFQKAIIKIKNTFLSDDSEIGDLKEGISFKINEAGNLEKFNDMISKINYSISKGKILDIKYYSINKDSETNRRINPYTIFCKRGVWYLIAYCHTQKEEKTFRISRIKSINITNDKFIKPRDFHLKEYLNKSWEVFREDQVLVKVKFDKSVTSFIQESEWLPNQEIELLKDENIVFKAYVSDLGEIKKWILGFGCNAEVLEPLSLREEIKQDTSNLLDKYLKKV